MKLLISASATALATFGATAAIAAGTVSGTTVTNTATVNFSVGGVAQTAVQGSTNFTVDRKVALTVTEPGNATTTVSPGQSGAVTTFQVTNNSNAPLDIGLAVADQSGGAASHAGTDNFDLTGLTIWVDTNGNGTLETTGGTPDTQINYVDELAPDTSRTVFVLGNVPGTRVNGDVASVILTARAREAGTSGTQGAVTTQTAGANTNGVDTVFADIAGFNDAVRDGQVSNRDDYTVSSAVLTVNKTATLLWDPFNGNTNPKSIPGAVVEYCIVVANAAGGANATGVNVSDPMPKDPANPTIQAVDYYGTASAAATNGDAAPGVLRNVDATATCTGGTAGGSTTGTAAANNEVVGGTLTDIPASTTRSFRFRTKIR
jgi:hypothetical protein